MIHGAPLQAGESAALGRYGRELHQVLAVGVQRLVVLRREE